MLGRTVRKRDGRRWAASALGLALLALVIGYVLRHWDEVVSGLDPHPAWLIAGLSGELVLVTLRAVMLREACRPFDVDVGRREAVGLLSWATLANHVATAFGGMGLRAAYLARRHRLDLAGFVSLTSALYAVQFLLLALAGLAATARVDAAAILWLRVAFATLAALCVALLAVPFPVPRGQGAVAGVVRRVVEGWRLLSGRPLVRLVPLQLLYVAAGAATVWAYFSFAGWGFSPGEALLVSTLSELSVLVPLTPAGLGILESAVGLGATLVGAPLAIGLTVAGVRRLVGLLVVALLAALFAPGTTLPSDRASRS